MAAALLAAISTVLTRFVRSRDRLPTPAQGVLVEPPSQTMRRTIVSMALPRLAVVAALAFSGGLAAVLGGVLAGIGAVDLANLAALRRRQAAGREVVYRELGGSPFAERAPAALHAPHLSEDRRDVLLGVVVVADAADRAEPLVVAGEHV